MTPAFTSSLLNLPISSSGSLLASTPASESLLALTITMKRIVLSPLVDCVSGRPERGSSYTSNERCRNRQSFETDELRHGGPVFSRVRCAEIDALGEVSNHRLAGAHARRGKVAAHDDLVAHGRQLLSRRLRN